MRNRIHTNRFLNKAAALLLSAGLVLGSAQTVPVFADAEHSEYARSTEMSKVKPVAKYGMTPITGDQVKDGTWPINIKSSSSFFRVHACELVVENHEMKARLTMETYSYPLLCLMDAESAAAAPASDYIEYEDIDDWYVFTIPVEALNKPLQCAAFSKKKKKWYSRTIIFEAASLDPEALNGLELPDYDLIEKTMMKAGLMDKDGNLLSDQKAGEAGDTAGDTTGAGNAADSASGDAEQGGTVTGDGNAVTPVPGAYYGYADDPAYAKPGECDLEDGKYSINVALTGGSGRATISTPTLMVVKDGDPYVQLLWSSSHYDWMQMGGIIYKNEAEEGGNSVFTIPIPAFDSVIPIIADTTAMGDPVAIEYSITFYQESIGDAGLIPQEAAKKVVIFAVILIVVGFFLNMWVKKRRKA